LAGVNSFLRILEMPKNSIEPLIRFYFQQQGVSLKNRGVLKVFLLSLFSQERTKLKTLNYIFCSDKYLLKINQDFLKHNDYTDIITFNLAPQGTMVEGEVYISIDRVKENSKLLGQSFTEELHRVIFHGALHLCGYTDKSKKQKQNMRNKEDQYLIMYLK
jgi:probable rRNA maturation factor